MRRRQFITLLGGAAAIPVSWPLAVRAQQGALPVVGFLNAASAETYAPLAAAFRKGLDEAGYADGRNVTIEYRWAEGHNERLPALAADLVQRQVAVIAATSTPAALAAKAATATTPIVFETAADPIQLRLVASLNRPGGNVTGVTQTNVEVGPKRLELLHELLPAARIMAFLVDPSDPAVAETTANQMLAAARTLGLELRVLNASAEEDFDAVFAKVSQLQASGLVIGAGTAIFAGRSGQLAALAARHAVPTVGANRLFVNSGGLISYGADIVDAYRLTGGYVGRILKGEKPADLPVQQATKIELRINLKAAKALGITVPLPLLGRADEVIE
ncbi:MAG TPA: ABC transporter substrate-binding protein [Bradyrhizobium sp.]|nr:ABC transporter substrate-binding protein [Bradyrhizobium sp.]